MVERVLGVLGGMGPLATIDFLHKLIEETPATRDQEHIPVIAWSVPQIPERHAQRAGLVEVHQQAEPFPSRRVVAIRTEASDVDGRARIRRLRLGRGSGRGRGVSVRSDGGTKGTHDSNYATAAALFTV